MQNFKLLFLISVGCTSLLHANEIPQIPDEIRATLEQQKENNRRALEALEVRAMALAAKLTQHEQSVAALISRFYPKR